MIALQEKYKNLKENVSPLGPFSALWFSHNQNRKVKIVSVDSFVPF